MSIRIIGANGGIKRARLERPLWPFVEPVLSDVALDRVIASLDLPREASDAEEAETRGIIQGAAITIRYFGAHPPHGRKRELLALLSAPHDAKPQRGRPRNTSVPRTPQQTHDLMVALADANDRKGAPVKRDTYTATLLSACERLFGVKPQVRGHWTWDVKGRRRRRWRASTGKRRLAATPGAVITFIMAFETEMAAAVTGFKPRTLEQLRTQIGNIG